MSVIITPANRAGKKFKVSFDGRTIYFGASGYDDFTTHRDETRKRSYIARHSARENWNDPNTAGFWSRWLLWNKPSLGESARDISRALGIRVVVKLH